MSWTEVAKGNRIVSWDSTPGRPSLLWDQNRTVWDGSSTSWDGGLTLWEDPPATWIF